MILEYFCLVNINLFRIGMQFFQKLNYRAKVLFEYNNFGKGVSFVML